MIHHKKRSQNQQEELFNGGSHFFGVILCLAIMPFLLQKSYHKSAIDFYATLAFGFGMLLVYTCSSAYHFAIKARLKQRLNIADHISIYFLIAGTYTPLMISYLDQQTATVFLGIMWTIVFVGSILKLFYTNKFEILSVLLYLILGWMIVFVIRPLTETVPDIVFLWLIIGGLSYTIGVYFYVNSYKKYFHFIWHLFVLFGTIAHCRSIWYSLI